MTNDSVYTVDELVDVLKVSRPVAYQLCQRADFPAIRVSQRRIIIPRVALENWLAREAEKGAAER